MSIQQSVAVQPGSVPASRVVAVIISYHPDLSVLCRLLDSLVVQFNVIVIVDNGSGPTLHAAIQTRGRQAEVFMPLGENLGIAAAQNAGIARARELGATHVVLFDHDSQPAADMLERLLACQRRLESEGRRVASVGPCYSDVRQDNPPPFIRVRGISLERCRQPEEGDAVSVDYLIASGCLIPMPALDVVGDMQADLFIDYVDIEWGQRARNRGYQNYGCFSAHMQHSLGDEPISFLGTAYPARSPLRHYYMFRNAVLLYKMSHIPLNWRLVDAVRLLPKFGFYILFAPPRWQQFKMMSLGLLHGLAGRTGKL